MISLTAREQEIVKSDSTVKTFRVHFPSGKHPDIVNENIAFESVKFGESVCSEQTFRFGRVEASTIEFEAVGASDMLGEAIECSMEFTLGSEYVSIPYGTFKVDSCQRDHTDMAHRRVRAYSDCAWYAKRSFEYYKSTIPRYVAQTYTPSIDYMVGSVSASARSQMTETQLTPGYITNQSILLNGFACDVAVDPEDTSKVIRAHYYSDSDMSRWEAKNYYIGFESSGTSGTNMDPDAVYKIVVPKGDDYDQFVQLVTENAALKGMRVLSDLLKNFAEIRCTSQQGTLNRYRRLLTGDAYMAEYDDRFELVLYPYMMKNDSTAKEFLAWSFIAGKFDLGYAEGGSQLDEVYAEGIEIFKTPIVYQYKITDTYMPRALYDYTEEVTDDTDLMYSFWNAFDMNEILQGYAEARASIVRIERGGDISVMRLDDSAPYALTAADVSGSAWWDEYDVAPIGTVYFKANTEEGEQTFGFSFSSDPSTYDMSDNSYFGSIVIEPVEVSAVSDMANPNYLYLLNGNLYYYDSGTWTDAGPYLGPVSVFTLLLKLHFVPYAGSVSFTPLEANFRGMPYLQCGDAITLTAEDGTVIHSYILAQSFNGVQYIEQDVDTVQGNVVGSEASY